MTANTIAPPGKETPNTHWIGDWMEPRASLDTVAKRQITFTTLPGIKPWSSRT